MIQSPVVIIVKDLCFLYFFGGFLVHLVFHFFSKTGFFPFVKSQILKQMSRAFVEFLTRGNYSRWKLNQSSSTSKIIKNCG